MFCLFQLSDAQNVVRTSTGNGFVQHMSAKAKALNCLFRSSDRHCKILGFQKVDGIDDIVGDALFCKFGLKLEHFASAMPQPNKHSPDEYSLVCCGSNSPVSDSQESSRGYLVELICRNSPKFGDFRRNYPKLKNSNFENFLPNLCFLKYFVSFVI